NLLATLGDILLTKGYEPVLAQTGTSALAQAEQHPLAVALIDLQLGDMSGLEVLRSQKKHSPQTECILLTGHASQNSAIEAIQVGAYGYFQKPFDVEQVLLSIQRAVEKHAIESALRESEDRYRDLVENSRDLICTHDLEGRILSANPWAAKTLGYAMDTLLQINLRDFLVPEARGGIEAYFAKIRKRGAANGLLQVQTATGERRIWEYYNTLRTEGVAVPVVRGMAHDITERKQAEELIKQTERHFRALIEKAPDGIALVGLDGKFMYTSPAARKMFGYAGDESVEITPVESTHPDDLPLVLTTLNNLIQDASLTPILQYRFKYKDGSWRWIESTFTNLLAEPSVQAIVINFRDITERKQVGDALRESEARFSTIFQASPVRVAITRFEDGLYLDVNEGFLESTGYTRKDVIGHTSPELNDWVDPAERIRLRILLEEQGPVRGFEARLRQKSDQVRDVLMSADLIELSGQRCILSVGVDITERKQAEDALIVSETRYRRLFEAAKDGILILEADTGQIIDVNPFLIDLLGYSREEFIGKELW
ncbi:MAG: PAS domain S-box protein, partial [Chloroflexi bacterium]